MDTFRQHLHGERQHFRSFKPLHQGFRYPFTNGAMRKAFASWQLQFCNELATRLPRELRDFIYEEILEEKYNIQFHAWNSSYSDYSVCGWATNLQPELRAPVQQLFPRELSGDWFAYELTETMYKP